MEMGLGKINGFEDVHLQLSRYESGSYKAEVYSNEDRLLLAFTEEGDAEEGKAPMYVRKSRYSEMILGKLMAAGIIFGYAGREGGFVAAVSPSALHEGGRGHIPCQPPMGQPA